MKCAVKLNEKRKIKSEAINNTVEYMIIAFVQFLGDKRGWKPKTICEALKYCVSHAEAIALFRKQEKIYGKTTVSNLKTAGFMLKKERAFNGN